nr:hypothetical protein [Tanacetum cinerariifolium]
MDQGAGIARGVMVEGSGISQSKVPSPGADETVFPIRDVRYREAFPTDTSLDAGHDRENIAKTSAMLYEALPRVTALGGGEGSGCSRHGGMDQGEDLLDRDKSADKGSDSTDEMSHVLGTLGAANILASRGLSVAIPTTRVTRSSRGVVIGSSSPISVNIPSISKKDKGKGKMTKSEQSSIEKVLKQLSVQLARDLEAKFAQKDQIIKEQAKRDNEIARIHAEKELEMMIAELDRSNEMVAKYLSEYEQAEAGLSHNEKVELNNMLLMYQRHLAQIKEYQAQQNKPATKTKRRNFYMSILRSNAGWKAKDFKGMTFEQIEEKFIPVWEKMQDFMPMNSKLESERLKRPRIHTTKVTDEKAKELWVELKRLYEHDSRDSLWALQRYMHDPLVWRLYDRCGVHHVSTGRGHQIFMLVEKDYPLIKGHTTLMLSNRL